MHHAALGLDAQAQRGHVEQQHPDLAAQHAGLQGRTDRDDLVGVDALVGLLAAGELLHEIGDRGHTGRAADEHHVVDVSDGDTGVGDDRLERRAGALQQIVGDLLELAARQLLVEEQRVLVGVNRDVGQVDRRALRRESSIFAFSAASRRRCIAILSLVRSMPELALNLSTSHLDDPLVPVVATELVVTGGSADLDDAVADFEQRDVEGAATEVEDQDGLFLLALVQAMGQGRGGGSLTMRRTLRPAIWPASLGRLALGVVEVGGHRDNRVADVLAQVGLGVALELHQGAGADLLRGVLLCRRSRRSSPPMWRLTERMVRSTLVTAWFLAGWPTRTSPLRANATTDGWCANPQRSR